MLWASIIPQYILYFVLLGSISWTLYSLATYPELRMVVQMYCLSSSETVLFDCDDNLEENKPLFCRVFFKFLGFETFKLSIFDILLQVLMNGVPMEEKYLSPEDFEEQLLTLIMKETQVGGW